MSILDQFRRLLGQNKGSTREHPTMPGFTDMPTSDDLPRKSEADDILAEIIEQAIDAGEGYRIKLSGSDRYQQLKKQPDETQLAVIEAAARMTPLPGNRSYSGNSFQVSEARKSIISHLLRRKIDVPVPLLKRLLNLWIKTGYSLEFAEVPGLTVLGATERHATEHGLSDELRPILNRINTKLAKIPRYRRNPTKWEQGVKDRITALLDPASVENRPLLPSGAFAEAFIDWTEQQSKAKREHWQALAAHTVNSANKSAPTKKWLVEAKTLLKALGKPVFAQGLQHWLPTTKPDPATPDHSLDILKGMVWMAPLVGSEDIAGAIGRFAEVCYRKVSGVGARSVKLGNAALYALSEMAEAKQAGAELFRLRSAIKYPSARKLLDRRIAELAKTSGTDIAALEDAALPDHGIGPEGTKTTDFGEANALLTLTSVKTEIAWTNAAGKQVKNPPAQAKADFKEELAAFKMVAKDIEKARAAQAKRLEESWLEGRSWTAANWQRHYCQHNLRRPLVEALVWQIETSEGTNTAVLRADNEFYDAAGNTITIPDDARVTLWHPLHAEPEQVLAWRQRILDSEITQPIKQAHREIYVLTDAERRTETYSNRFAAHILRQHQFRALCHARGWQFEFLGGWDNWNVPTRSLPALSLAVEYSVEAVEDGQRTEAYVPLHLASDQVRFIDTAANEQLALLDVDPIIFSELMRDVDLFVAVTSVANDPGWADGGPDGRFGNYWREWAFGDLGQSAETRKELIADIAPRLSIADKLEISEKSLLVTGKRHQYAIHFGSANIQIMPENRYLCIVPDRNPAEADRIRLPFAGDNQLSTILAKAFMLVNEDKITDKTILSQL